MAYEALQQSILRDEREQFDADKAKKLKQMKRKHDSPKTPPGSPPPPPPPPPLSGPLRASGTTEASDSAQDPLHHLRLQQPTRVTSLKAPMLQALKRHLPQLNILLGRRLIQESSLLSHQYLKNSIWTMIRISTNRFSHLASALASTYTPPPENSLLAQTSDIATFMDWFCKKQGITESKQQDLEGPAYKIVKVFHPNVIYLQYQMEECHKLLTDQVDEPIIRYHVSKPLPLGGPPSQVTIQSDFFFNKDLEYLRYGRKSGIPALSISKMKAAYYPDVGHTSEGDRRVVRTHMRILSVVRIEVFSLYGYDYMKKIVLRRADLKEYTIAKRDFKYLYPSDFEDLYLLSLQGHLNHLPPKDKKILTTALNLTKPRWDATGFEFKHDFTVIDSPRAVTLRDKYGVQMIMRFNEIHKFSDGTLQQIDEALDYRVKEFKVNRTNPGLNTRFWTRKDVDRSKEFMFSIQKRLRTRRIFRNLESFVGGRIREGDYRLLTRTE
ncbi:hypothetical protein Tco_1392789 [Tanacetum coccineum]